MKNWLFPQKAHPEDNNLNIVAIARLLALFWLICAVWSVWCLVELGQTARYAIFAALVLPLLIRWVWRRYV